MKWDKASFEVGGKVVVPHAFKGSEPAEICSLTDVGMAVLYGKGTPQEQRAFFAFSFLKQQYGEIKIIPPKNDLDDEIPWNL